MSLINDLLLELEHRDADPATAADPGLAGLEPPHRPAGSRSGPSFGVMAFASGLAFAVGLALPSLRGRDAEGALLQPVSQGVPLARLELGSTGGHARPVPAVSAAAPRPRTAPSPRPAAGAVPPSSTASPNASSVTGTRLRASGSFVEGRVPLAEGPASTVTSIALERSSLGTRLRIEADSPSPFRVEEGSSDREIDLVLADVFLTAPVAPLDLDDTPIRRLATNTGPQGLRLSLAFDAPTRVQGRWVEEARGRAALLVDLQVAAGSTSEAGSADAMALPVPAPAPTPRSTTAPTEPAEHGGDVRISRSQIDRERVDEEARRRRAAERVQAGRLARAEGDRDTAEREYAASLSILPGYRDAVLEWADLLAARGEREAGLALVRQARRGAAETEPGLLMLHARLVAEGGALEEAVELLDGSGVDLDEAPEIHALAAAYRHRLGDHDEAIERYERILRRHPSRARWWMGLGISLEAAGRPAEALDVYRIAREVGPLPAGSSRWVATRIEALDGERS